MTVPISNITPIGMPQMPPASGAAGQPGEFQNVLSSAESLQNNAADSVQKFLSGQN